MMVGIVFLFPNCPFDNVPNPVGSPVLEPGWSEISPQNPIIEPTSLPSFPTWQKLLFAVNGGGFCNWKVYRWSGVRGTVEFPGYNFQKLQVRPHCDSTTSHNPYCSPHSQPMLGAHPASGPTSMAESSFLTASSSQWHSMSPAWLLNQQCAFSLNHLADLEEDN